MISLFLRVFQFARLNATAVIPIVILLVIIGAYELGKHVGSEETKMDIQLQAIKEKYRQEKVKEIFEDKVEEMSGQVTLNFFQYQEEKEKAYGQTDKETRRLLDKFDVSSLQYSGGTPNLRSDEDLSATSPTSVGEILYGKGLSKKDRAFLIEEAARADKIVEELNQCKMMLNDIYTLHGGYLEQLKVHQESLKKKK